MDYNLSLGNVDVSVELVIVLAILALGYYLLLVLGKNTDRYQQNRDNDARKIQYFSGFKNGIRHLGVVLFKTRCQSVPSKVSDGKEYHNGNKCYPNLGHLSKYNLDKTRCQSQQRRTLFPSRASRFSPYQNYYSNWRAQYLFSLLTPAW